MPTIADLLRAKYRDGNLFNRHRVLGLTGNDSQVAYYKNALSQASLSVVGTLNDLMVRWWTTQQKLGVNTNSVSNSFEPPFNNIVQTAGDSAFVNITGVVGADSSAVVSFQYTLPDTYVSDMEYSLNGGVDWLLLPTPLAEFPYTPTSGSSSTVTITGLENDTLYSVSLRALEDPETALVPASAPFPVRPNVSAVPDAPTSLVATPSNTSVNIEFTAGAVGTAAITGYEYTINGGTTWAAAGSSTVSPVTIPGLTASTSYTIALRAVNSVGASVASTSVTTTTLSTGFLGTSSTETITGGYKYHVFTSSGTLTVTNPGVVEYLVVGGGGSGAPSIGSASGGGGGAGGYLTGTSLSVTANQTITVGAGGASVTGTGTAAPGNQGSNSSIGSLVTALGGGYGGSVQAQGASNGGSGGGKGANATNTTPAGTGTSGQGHSGGISIFLGSSTNAAGGGGGATSVGDDGFSSGATASNVGGAGGSGAAPSWISALTGVPTSFAGGGGGGIGGSTGTLGAGASGGGTGGGTAVSATSALVNTGSGGGGGGRAITTPYYSSGAGGSGIVIIRYAI